MKSSCSQKGFSLIELLLVIMMIAILVAVSVMSFASTRKYDADNQALELVDLLNQARQSALNQRRVFRVEINKTKRQVSLINENDFNTADDDRIVKFITLRKGVFVNEVPSNVAAAPTASTPIPILDFVSSGYPLSSGEEKVTLRFARNGRVLDTGSDSIGTGSLMRGATIYVYTNREGTDTPEIIRAVTVTQTSGSTSILRCSFDSTKKCGNWKR